MGNTCKRRRIDKALSIPLTKTDEIEIKEIHEVGIVKI